MFSWNGSIHKGLTNEDEWINLQEHLSSESHNSIPIDSRGSKQGILIISVTLKKK